MLGLSKSRFINVFLISIQCLFLIFVLGCGEKNFTAPTKADKDSKKPPGNNNTNMEAPAITSHLANVVVDVGDPVVFSVQATGENLSYIWKKGDVILGDFGSQMVLDSSTEADSGLYSVVVANEAGEVTSSGTLGVNGATVTFLEATECEVGPGSGQTCEPECPTGYKLLTKTATKTWKKAKCQRRGGGGMEEYEEYERCLQRNAGNLYTYIDYAWSGQCIIESI